MINELNNAVLIQGASLADIERMISHAIDTRLREFKPQPTQVIVTPKEPKYIKRKDAAAMLGVSLTSLDKWTASGFIRPCRICSRIYYTEEEIARAMGCREDQYHG